MGEIEIHQRENNPESEGHLQANAKKFSQQCALVHRLLAQGKELTSRIAMIEYGIGDLHRRVGELRDWHGIKIKDRWEMNADGKTTRNKVWYIEIPKQPGKSDIIANWNNLQQGKLL